MTLLVAAVVLSLLFGQPKPDVAQTKETQPIPRIADVVQQLRPVFVKRAKQCFRLPDDSICDASQYYELQEVMGRTIDLVQDTVRRPAGGLVTYEPVGVPQWRVDQSDLAKAWRIRIPSESPSIAGLNCTGRHVFTRESGSSTAFIFIDEANQDSYSKSQGHKTKIFERLPGNIVKVQVRPLSQQATTMYVQLPDGLKVDDDWLPGKFVLWPDLAIEHPAGIKTPEVTPTDPQLLNSVVCRYVSVASPAITADDLVAAAHRGTLLLSTWTWKKSGDLFVWTKDVIALKLRPTTKVAK